VPLLAYFLGMSSSETTGSPSVAFTQFPSPMTLAFDQNADGLGTSKIPHTPILVGGEFSRLHYGSLSLRPADLLALLVGADQVLTQPTRAFTFGLPAD
jgi:hypothetical protein